MKDAACSLRTDVLRIMHIAFCSQTDNVLEEMTPSSVETSLSTKGFLDYPVELDLVLPGAYAFLPFVREGTEEPATHTQERANLLPPPPLFQVPFLHNSGNVVGGLESRLFVSPDSELFSGIW